MAFTLQDQDVCLDHGRIYIAVTDDNYDDNYDDKNEGTDSGRSEARCALVELRLR